MEILAKFVDDFNRNYDVIFGLLFEALNDIWNVE